MHLPDGFEAWQVWLALAVLLGVLELLSLDLVLLMLAVGAVVGMAGALVGLDVWLQVLAGAAASVAALGFVRPGVVKRLQAGPNLVLGHDALVGKRALVVERVSAHGGQVRIEGELWTARPYDEDAVIEPGATAEVFLIRGATAVVHEVPELTGG